MDIVICNKANESCTSRCSHAVPHIPLHDEYVEGKQMYCNEGESVCVLKEEDAYCMCQDIDTPTQQ